MSTQKIILGSLTAALAGVAVGMLLAPAKGTETRQKITDTADKLKKKLRSIRGCANGELHELEDIFGKEVDGLKEDVRQKVLRLIETSKRHYQNEKEEALSN